MGVASPQLPVKYLQLPPLLISQTETLIWRIEFTSTALTTHLIVLTSYF